METLLNTAPSKALREKVLVSKRPLIAPGPLSQDAQAVYDSLDTDQTIDSLRVCLDASRSRVWRAVTELTLLGAVHKYRSHIAA